jgi:hypothetical protein
MQEATRCQNWQMQMPDTTHAMDQMHRQIQNSHNYQICAESKKMHQNKTGQTLLVRVPARTHIHNLQRTRLLENMSRDIQAAVQAAALPANCAMPPQASNLQWRLSQAQPLHSLQTKSHHHALATQ